MPVSYPEILKFSGNPARFAGNVEGGKSPRASIVRCASSIYMFLIFRNKGLARTPSQ